jgi:ribosomal protein L7Ae-like RNA K-turn-binding protein
MSGLDERKLLGLLGLANRAGKLAVGFSAVEKMVRRGQRPLVVTAQGVGTAQLEKIKRWDPVAGLILDALDAASLAAALGRDKLVVVGVADPGFIKGIRKLEN